MGRGSSYDKKMSPDPLLSSQKTQEKQNGVIAVNIPPKDGKSSNSALTALLYQLKQRTRVEYYAILSTIVIFILIIIIIVVAQSAKKCELPPPAPVYIVAACPDGWIGYLGECYYFSESEANWTSSQSNCSAHGASLAGVDTQQEMDFMMLYKGSSNNWIGLQRDPGQPWKWTNGTEFNNWFTVRGEEKCAFLNHNKVSSSGCSGEKFWICSKPMEKTGGKAK